LAGYREDYYILKEIPDRRFFNPAEEVPRLGEASFTMQPLLPLEIGI